ncbi:hypothetical protein EBZ39_06955 [bacterium]|nr:hypothetical protein [bacterium]
MPRLEKLPPGKLKIHADHFRKVVDRIEEIKPLAGDGIKIRNTSDGFEISTDAKSATGPAGTSANDFAKPIVLTVCSNGQPSIIYVLGFNSKADLETAGLDI